MRRSSYLVVIVVGLALVTGTLIFGLADPAAGQSKGGGNSSAPPAKKGDPKPGDALSKFMRQKLEASNQVLEGLVTEDFALIEKGAGAMKRLSVAEQWQISNDAMYRQHSKQFQGIMEKLEKRAKDKQLEGATLAWVEGTMSCLECHKWVRSNIVAGR